MTTKYSELAVDGSYSAILSSAPSPSDGSALLSRRRYVGIMQHIHRCGGMRGAVARFFLKRTSRRGMLFSQTGRNIPFIVEHHIEQTPDGRLTVARSRTFFFQEGPERCEDLMEPVPGGNSFINRIGFSRRLEAELTMERTDSGIRIRSGKQWYRLGSLRLPIPSSLTGRLTVDEWKTGENGIGIRVAVYNPLLGDILDYEGIFDTLYREQSPSHIS